MRNISEKCILWTRTKKKLLLSSSAFPESTQLSVDVSCGVSLLSTRRQTACSWQLIVHTLYNIAINCPKIFDWETRRVRPFESWHFAKQTFLNAFLFFCKVNTTYWTYWNSQLKVAFPNLQRYFVVIKCWVSEVPRISYSQHLFEVTYLITKRFRFKHS